MDKTKQVAATDLADTDENCECGCHFACYDGGDSDSGGGTGSDCGGEGEGGYSKPPARD